MTTAQGIPATPEVGTATPTEAGRMLRAAAFVGTVLVIIALSVLPLLTPLFIHPGLDAAGSARRLGIEPAQAHEMSDRSVDELVFGPASFAFDGPDGQPFYDSSERDHLRDARVLLWLFLGVGVISAIGLGLAIARASGERRASIWRTISRAGAASAITVVVLGVVSLVAFSTLFTLFHQVFFPAGNWAFDPNTQRLVQLYPFSFWQIAAGALGALVFVFGSLTWLIGRTLSRRSTGAAAETT